MTIALRFHRPLLVPQNTPTIELDVLRSKRNGRKMEYEGYNRGRGQSITSPRVARRHRLFGASRGPFLKQQGLQGPS
ncbi:unnamed protein product [Ascophyllum nodosum]